MRQMFLASVAVVALVAPASALTVVNDGTDEIQSWGGTSTPKYGQTFVAGAESTLESITFRINDNGAAIDFMAYVFSWDAALDRATGPALFESAAITTAGVSGYMPVTVSTGGLALTEGEDYVAFYFATTGSGGYWLGNADPGSYAGGEFVYQNDATLAAATSIMWDTYTIADTAFALEFSGGEGGGGVSEVPVPAALPMLAGALGLFGLMSRARRA